MAARKKKKPQPSPKEQICVRMDKALYDLLARDATEVGRTNPAQARMILRAYYAKELAKPKSKRRKGR